jgi:hypothetical protein
MTGTHHLPGTGPGFLSQIGRLLTVAIMSTAAILMLFFSAAFALFLIGAVLVVSLIALTIFWIRAKLTGRPFGPRAQMDARMAEFRRQMGVDLNPGAGSDKDRGPVIDAHQTPEGWTVER